MQQQQSAEMSSAFFPLLLTANNRKCMGSTHDTQECVLADHVQIRCSVDFKPNYEM